MCKILISINPVHVDKILNGSKKYEYRKVSCREDVESMIIYSTSPVMKVVAEAKISMILEGRPETIWNQTKQFSGISKDYYDEYYKGRNKAIAFKIENVIVFDEKKLLSDYGVECPPQSFIYV